MYPLIQRRVIVTLSDGLNVLGKLLSCIGEYEGLRLGGICVRVYIEVAKIQHSNKKIAQSKKAVL